MHSFLNPTYIYPSIYTSKEWPALSTHNAAEEKALILIVEVFTLCPLSLSPHLSSPFPSLPEFPIYHFLAPVPSPAPSSQGMWDMFLCRISVFPCGAYVLV